MGEHKTSQILGIPDLCSVSECPQLKDNPAGSQSPPAAQAGLCCPLDIKEHSPAWPWGWWLGYPQLSKARGGLPLELHASLEAPQQGDFIAWAYWAQFGLQITAQPFDSWFAEHPRNICKETKISLSTPVNYIHLTFIFKKAVSSYLNMINSKGINVQHTKSLKYKPSCFGEKQNSRPFCFLFLSLQETKIQTKNQSKVLVMKQWSLQNWGVLWVHHLL